MLEVLRVGVALSEAAVNDAVRALGTDPDPIEALRAAIIAHAGAVLGMGDYPRANVRNFGQLPREIADAQMSHQQRYGDVWRKLIQAALASGCMRHDLDPRAARLLILGALNWAPEWYKSRGELSPRDVGEQMAAMIIEGLVAPEATQPARRTASSKRNGG